MIYKNYKKHGYNPVDKVRLDAYSDICNKVISKAKEDYLNLSGSKLANPSTSKKTYWKIINRVMNKCKAPKIPPLLVDNKFIIDCKEKANIFARFFADQCKLLVNDSVLPNPTLLTNSKLESFTIFPDEITSLIRSLDSAKAGGPDGISAQMLLLCDDTVTVPLKLIYNQILLTGIFPDFWKTANVTPIHKKADKQLSKNYRPISLLPICGKIFEKIVANQLYDYLTSNNLITKNQSGFRPGDSTTNQLLGLINEIHKSFENRLEVRAIFLDISKAFDKVWHQGLVYKLQQNGVTGNCLSFFKNYLINRNYRVALNGCFSDYYTAESGVPQGSVLGPLLFLIYINDLEMGIKSNIKFFADDSMIYSISDDPISTSRDLNHDLSVIGVWAKQWKMSFNPDVNKQAVEVLFSHKSKQNYHPSLFSTIWLSKKLMNISI